MAAVKKKENLYSFKRVILSKKSYAKKFAEKNKELYDLLLTCFDHKIETVKCSPGKEMKNIVKKPYITFRLNAYNKKFLVRVLNAVPKEDIIVTFAFNHLGHKTVTFKDLDESTDLFYSVEKALLDETIKEDKTIMKVYNFVMDLKAKNTSIKVIYGGKDIRYYINTMDDNIIAELEKKLFPALEEMNIKLNVLG